MPNTEPELVSYRPYGAIADSFTCKVPELVLDGPAGTGKSRGMLERDHLLLMKYPGCRGLMVRKTRTSMTETCMFTYENKVLKQQDGVIWRANDQKYLYPNGSEFVVSGMDKPTKIYSSEYDFAYWNECVEASEPEWEILKSRLRNGVLPFQQLQGDCNPDSEHHFLRKRMRDHKLVMLQTRHEDNPMLYDQAKGDWTPFGKKYVFETLESLSGVRYKRLRLGLWVAAEGVVYEDWDRTVHVIDPFEPTEEDIRLWAVDFGFIDPFVWQEWLLRPNGDLVLYRQIYQTRRTVEQHAEMIVKVTRIDKSKKVRPLAIITDHDAEDRATLENHLGLPTVPAFKSIQPGLQACMMRLKRAKLGKRGGIYYMRDSLLYRDPLLDEQKKPICTEEEYESYVWPVDGSKLQRLVPADEYNHGMDAKRYVVCFVDNIAVDPTDVDEVVLYADDDDDRVIVSPY